MCGKRCMSKKEACECISSFHRRLRKDGTRGKWWTHKIPIRWYWCDECKAYHVTSLNHYEDKTRKQSLSDRHNERDGKLKNR